MNEITSITGRDFIILGIQSIDDEYGNIKNIAYEIAKYNRVLFIHSPVDRISSIKLKNHPVIKKKLAYVKGEKAPLVQVHENLFAYYPTIITESINWLKIPFLFNLLNKINGRRFAKQIGKAIHLLKIKNFILINDNDFFRGYYLKDFLPPHINVYYSRDFLTHMNYWKTHGQRLEPALIRKADLCVANSFHLKEYCSRYNDKSYFVGQGCDSAHFSSLNVREDIVLRVNKDLPIIGYLGALVHERLNIELILHIARSKPLWNIVLVGPEDAAFKQSELHIMPNVFFLGEKPFKDAPSFIHLFDVCINPQSINEMTIGNYPLKIDEYLAMGKPVVATNTKAMEIFEGHIYLANTIEEFIFCIEKALKEMNTNTLKESRRAFAVSHSWENSVKEIYKYINIAIQNTNRK